MLGKKLLVADDSLTIQKVIRLALSNEGYEIQAVSDGNDAIQQIALFRPDVVLIDVSLPGKTAVEVKKIVAEHGASPEIKFILMSSAFEQVDPEREEAAHFEGKLTKPFDPAHLRKILTDVLSTASVAKPGSEDEKTSEIHFDEGKFAGSKYSEPKFEDTAPVATITAGAVSLEPPELDLLDPPTEQDSLWDTSPVHEPDAQNKDDIKQLTESTIRLSGLDDYQWSVNEDSAKKVLSSGSASPLSAALPGLEGKSEEEFAPIELEEKSLPNLDPAEIYRNAPVTLDDHEVEAPGAETLPPPPPTGVRAEPNVLPLTAHQMEEILQAQLKETLEKMAQKMLPDVAEKIIKQEIRKMLENPV